MNQTFVLRFALAIVFGMHSVPSFLTGDVIEFGKDYLAALGFGIFGVPLAILVKSIHLFSIVTLLTNRYLKITIISNAIILLFGIYFVHFTEGWYVVGGGRNGVEFNFILLAILMYLWFVENKK